MKILAVNWHSGIEDASTYVGGYKRASKILAGLAKKGHRICLVDAFPAIMQPAVNCEVHEIPQVFSPIPENFILRAIYAIAMMNNILFRTCQCISSFRPEIIYVPCGELGPALYPAYVACLLYKLPLVVVPQTIIEWRSKEASIHKLRKHIYRHARSVVVVNPAAVDPLVRSLEGRAHVEVGLNGVETTKYGVGGSLKERFILFLGRVTREKGYEDALFAYYTSKAWQANVKLKIAGHVHISDKKRLEQLVRRYDLRNYVEILGAVSDEEKFTLLCNALIYIAPSYIEHFGLALREALSIGTVCVVYDLPAFNDLNSHPCLHLVPLGDRKALSDALAKCLRLDDKTRKELSIQCMMYRVGPTWEQAVEREEQILYGALADERQQT